MSEYNEVIVLIAEDNDGHAELIKEQLREVGVNNEVIRFSDGDEIWNFLSKKGNGKWREENKEYLLLLDISMPKMNGIDVLKNLKEDEKLKSIPVVMLTTTDDPREIEECYKIGCNVYITKPINFIKFTDKLKNLGLMLNIVSIAKV